MHGSEAACVAHLKDMIKKNIKVETSCLKAMDITD